MDTLPVAPAVPAARRPLWREPLLHFLALGALVLVLHRAFVGPEEGDGGTIVVDAGVRATIRESFEARYGHAPNDEEASLATQRWIDDEILFREGLALGLQHGDPVVRQRLLQAMRFTLDRGVVVREPTQDELRAHYDAHPERFRPKLRWTFERVDPLPVDGLDAATAAELAMAALEAGADPRSLGAGYSKSGGMTRGRTAEMFGRRFAEALQQLPEGEWRAMEIDGLWMVVRLTDVDEGGDIPPLDAIQATVALDWLESQREVRRQATVDAARGRYVVIESRDEPRREGDDSRPEAPR
jgi:hypothetical protein